MPNSTLTDALKEAYASAPTDKYIIETIELEQSGVQTSIRIANSFYDIVANDENSVERTFVAAQFELGLPGITSDGILSLSFSISNLDNIVGSFFQTATSDSTKISMIYRPYLSDDLTTPAASPPLELFVESVEINKLNVKGTATFADVVNAKFPRILYNRQNFPGLG